MGDTDVNAIPGRHGREGAPDGGYTLVLHKASTKVYEQAPDTTWPLYRAILIAARTGDDAALDAAATEAWGAWWSGEVIARNLRSLARYQLARYIPLALPIP